MLLAEPLEFIDLHDGESMLIRVDAFQDGSTVIHTTAVTPRHRAIHMHQKNLTEPPADGMPISNEIPALRLYGSRLDKPSSQAYFDTSSKTLRADLLARFSTGLQLPTVLKLTATGIKPRKRYSVEAGGNV